jgi:hypothetical protein
MRELRTGESMIKAVKSEVSGECIGCYFNPDNLMHHTKCNQDIQTLEGIRLDCSVDEIIYKEEKQMNEIEWKDLDIKNIPSDFFVNDNYEIQRTGEDGIVRSDVSNKTWIINALLDGEDYYFFYRLKPLEPHKITKPMHDYILNCLQNEEIELCLEATWDEDTIFTFDKKKVEIIGDSE